MEQTFTPDQIVEEATLWFMTFNGTYARLLKRTKAEGKRAFVVFCDQALFFYRFPQFSLISKKFRRILHELWIFN